MFVVCGIFLLVAMNGDQVLGQSQSQAAGTTADGVIVPESCGRDFIFTYPASHPSVTHDAYVLITTYSTSSITVTVSVPGIGFTNTSMVSQTHYANVTFPRSVQFLREDLKINKTVLITADDAVCVYGLCTSGSTADGFNVLPKTVLSQRYILTSYEPLINYRHPSEFVVTALDEPTVVDITFNHDGHETIQQTLYPYESYQYRDFNHDLTGTVITSNKPVSVMSGNECANVPNTIGKCEFLITHLPGTEGFGRNFVLSPFLGRISGYVFRVLAITNNTNVTMSTGINVQLSEFQFYEGEALDASIVTTISTSQDVIVTQFAKGLYSDYKTGDPFMLLVPPTDFFANNVTFPVTTIPSYKPLTTSINVIVRCEENLDISLNGQVVEDWDDRLNSDGEFCVLRKNVDPGLHTVGHPSRDARFVVLVYGFVWRASYGYFAGYNFQKIDTSTPATTEAPPTNLLTLPTASIVFPDSAGRHFVFAFPTPTTSMRNVYLLITTLTMQSTTVSVKIPSITFQTSAPVSRDQHANVTLPYNTIDRLSSTTQNTVIVMAQTPVSVFAVCGGRTTIDAFIILPSTTHGSEYVIASYQPLIAYGHASEFTVSSLDKQTRINITSPTEPPMTYLLQPYETRMVRNLERDLTGTRIYSTNPISIVSGCQCANVPADIGKCEYIVDHLSPAGSFGRQFVVAPFLGRRSGYVFRVMTAGMRANVRLSDGRSFLIPAYSFWEVDVVTDDVISVASDNPVMVSQFAKGCYSDYLTGDPFMMLIPPVESFAGSVTFPVTSISTTESQKAYASIIIDCRMADGLILDGQSISKWRKLIASEGFCALRNRISVGVHTVWHQNQDAKFAVMVYAHAWRAAYGYMAGYNIQIQAPTTEGMQTSPTTTARPPPRPNPKTPKWRSQDNSIVTGFNKPSFTDWPGPVPPQNTKETPTKGDGEKGPNSAGNSKANSASFSNGSSSSAPRSMDNFLMFMVILAVLLILVILFALLLFWREWRKRAGGFKALESPVSFRTLENHNDNDTKSMEGMAMESAEPEPFAEFDKNPLL